MENHYDLIVIGLGAMGSAALYQAAKAGATVLGIDRYAPPHEFGSSHAETRITRLAVGEGPEYLPLVFRSHEIWRELEAETGQPLLYETGGYIITPADSEYTQHDHWYKFVPKTAAIAANAGIPFDLRTPTQVRNHLPNVLMRDGDQAGFEPSGGVVLCERAVETQLALAQKLGATMNLNEPVVDIAFGEDTVVVSNRGRYTADKIIITTGPWMPGFLPQPENELLRVTRQVVFWFEVADPAIFSSNHFPFFLWAGDRQEDYFAIFPMTPNGVPGLKVLTEQFVDATDPESVSRKVTQADIDSFYENYVTKRLTGVMPNCVKASVCLYTSTPDEHFIIDHHPKSERVVVVSACSSHGFKHSAAIGESTVQWVMTGQSQIDLKPFGLGRFGGNHYTSPESSCPSAYPIYSG